MPCYTSRSNRFTTASKSKIYFIFTTYVLDLENTLQCPRHCLTSYAMLFFKVQDIITFIIASPQGLRHLLYSPQMPC